MANLIGPDELNQRMLAGIASRQAMPQAPPQYTLQPQEEAVPAEAPAEVPETPEQIQKRAAMEQQIGGAIGDLLPKLFAYAGGGAEGVSELEANRKAQAESAMKKQELALKDFYERAKIGLTGQELGIKQYEAETHRGQNALKQAQSIGERETALREELSKNKQVQIAAASGQSFSVLQNLYNQSLKNPDAVKDVSLVYNFVKALDPNSAVKEQEYDLVKNARGIMGSVPGLYERFKSGQGLLPAQRQQMLKAAADAYQGNVNGVRPALNAFSDLAVKYGVDPKAVVQIYGFPGHEQFETARSQGQLNKDITNVTKQREPAGPSNDPLDILASKGVSPEDINKYAIDHDISQKEAIRVITKRALKGNSK